MADVPHEAPHVAAKSGIQSLKKLPPWAIISILGGGLLLMLYIRHSKAATANSTTQPDPNASAYNTPYTDPSLNQPYNPSYYDPTGGLGGFVSGGAVGSPVLPSPAGPTTPTDTGGGGTTVPSGGGITNTFSPTVTNAPVFSPIITGGGAPAKPGGVHGTPAAPTIPRFMWDNKKKKWVLGSSEGFHYDTKTKKWVK